MAGKLGAGIKREMRHTRSRCWSASIKPSSSSLVRTLCPTSYWMMRGKGGECASISATGVPGVQTRQRRRWDGEPRMRHRHLRQTCAGLYHHRSSRQSCRILPFSSCSKGLGQQRWNIFRSESSSRMWIDVQGGFLSLGRVYLPVNTYSGRASVPLELRLKATALKRRNRHAMRSVRVVRGSALLTI